jgi:hypothetical protein
VATAVIESSRLLVDRESDVYRIVYSAGTIAILVASFFVGWKEKPKALSVLASMAPSLLFGWLAYKEMVVEKDTIICLVEGMLLTFVGLLLLTRVPFSKDRLVYGTLAVFWLVLAFFDYVFVVNFSDWWLLTSDWVPTLCGLAAFGWIIRNRYKRQDNFAAADSW